MSSEASTAEPFDPVEYPSSDGEPMAETDLHRDEMVALIEGLKLRYRDRADIYVAGNLFVYYEKGNPNACFAPDVLVVIGVAKKQRHTYKLWEEKLPPALVIEVSSNQTWLKDVGEKRALCERLGVREYILFDPEGDYLEPRLQGYRLDGGEYQRIETNERGHLPSQVLGMWLHAEGLHLNAVDMQTGEPLPTLEREHLAKLEAQSRAAQAQSREAALEEENARLRQELDTLRRRGS